MSVARGALQSKQAKQSPYLFVFLRRDRGFFVIMSGQMLPIIGLFKLFLVGALLVLLFVDSGEREDRDEHRDFASSQ